MPDTGYATLWLRAIADREELYALFECYLAQDYSKIRKRYYMTEAWFCTLILGDYEKMTRAMSRAEEIVQATADTPLAIIDDVILPWMAMLTSSGNMRRSRKS